MHRRDYILIAKVLKKIRKSINEDAFIVICNEFSLSLKEENHSFNETKFRDYIEKGG